MMLFALPRPRRVNTPMLVLGARRDAIFIPRGVRRTGRAYHGDVKVFPGMAHDVMLEPDWQSVADAVLAWLALRDI